MSDSTQKIESNHHRHRRHHHHHRKGRMLRIYNIIIAVLIVIALVALYIIGDLLLELKEAEDFSSDDVSVVTIGNKKYTEKILTTVLIIGQDTRGAIESNGSYNNSAQADFLALVAINKKSNTYSILQINRDTMAEIDELGVTGERTGDKVYAQIALSHTYGDGTAISNMNTRRAVSNLLCNVAIDYCVSMSLDAVSALNDSLGGVTLMLDKDYTDIDASFLEGEEVTFSGDTALRFVQGRTGVEDETNISRMARQRLYLEAFIERLAELDVDYDFISNMYENVASKGLINTDCSVTTAFSTIESLASFTCEGLFVPEGEVRTGGGGTSNSMQMKKSLHSLQPRFILTVIIGEI